MKSIKEWMKEKGLCEDTSSGEITSFGKFINSTTFETDAKIKTMLHGEIDRIRKSEEFANVPKEELNRKIISAVELLLADLGSTKAGIRQTLDRIDSSDTSNPKNDGFKDDPIAQEVK